MSKRTHYRGLAAALGLALLAPTAPLAFAESSVGVTDIYAEIAAAQQPRVTLWDLLRGGAQSPQQEARGVPTAVASDAGPLGSSPSLPATPPPGSPTNDG